MQCFKRLKEELERQKGFIQENRQHSILNRNISKGKKLRVLECYITVCDWQQFRHSNAQCEIVLHLVNKYKVFNNDRMINKSNI